MSTYSLRWSFQSKSNPVRFAKQIVLRGNLKILILALVVLAALPMLYAGISTNHAWDDWTMYFRPAALQLLHGQSPYGNGYYNAPWLLLPLIPLALLPYAIGRFLFLVLSVAGFTFLVRRLTSNPVSIQLFLTSLPVIFCLDGGNIDWIPMLSFVLPAPMALIFAAIKPQIGLGVAVFWLVESWRQGGVRQVVRTFLPVSLLLGASFVFYGLWPISASALTDIRWNLSIFPYTLPVGLYLLWVSLARRTLQPGTAAGLLISPYFTIISLSALLVPLLERPRQLAVAWVILWAGIITLVALK